MHIKGRTQSTAAVIAPMADTIRGCADDGRGDAPLGDEVFDDRPSDVRVDSGPTLPLPT